MYSSRASNAYGQSYGGQSGYSQNLGSVYSGSSVVGPDIGSQHPLSSRHLSMLSNSQEADIGGYEPRPSSAAHYGGQYGSVYGSAALTTAQQVPAHIAKGTGSSALEGRGVYSSALPDSPKFASSDYVSSSSHGYSHKGNQIFADKISDYPAVDRQQYSDRRGAYMVRDLQGEPTARYTDSVGLYTQHQPDIYGRIDQASRLRQEYLLKSQSLQSPSVDGGARQIDYLAARGAVSRHSAQDTVSYGKRMDADPRSSSMLSASSHDGQHAPSILGAVPRRNVDDHLYPQSSSNPGYGVSLPPGRDYGSGKGLHGTSLESDYLGNSLFRGGVPRIDEQRDDRATYLREFEGREEERHQDHLREREKEGEREKERQRDRDRERARKRVRERERDRDRERERKRDRERILELREKEREGEYKRGIEPRRERTPRRPSMDHRGSSLIKEVKSLRRDSLSREVLHRRHSPVKEKRREYACKVHSFSLVAEERDYLSIDKRYPRLFIAPEFTKAVVHWPKQNLKLSIHTPVSFEHDFVEAGSIAELADQSREPFAEDRVKLAHGSTVWNAKIILMSGLSRNALEDLSSERNSNDRIPHIFNILRFAVLKRDRSFMAIGGPWSSADGGDPSVDDSVLIRTALRYAKDVVQLDLQSCSHWNRFLEIHYDRVGKDGFFSHKEVTVIFLPDLSKCLPSLDAWQDQWLAHKKAVFKRERELQLPKEKTLEKKERLKGKEIDSSKDSKQMNKSDKNSELASSGEAVDVNKTKEGNSMEGVAVEGQCDELGKYGTKNGGMNEGGNIIGKEQEETGLQTAGSEKPGRKKIIRKIVKNKVADKKLVAENTGGKKESLDEKVVEEKDTQLETSGERNKCSAKPAEIDTLQRKITKKVPMPSTAAETDNDVQPDLKDNKDADCSEDKQKDKSDPGSTPIVKDATVKTTIKRKIIKRVPKKKTTGEEASDGAIHDADPVDKNADTGEHASEVKKSIKKVISKKKTEAVDDKKDNVSVSCKTTIVADKEDTRTENESDIKNGSGAEVGMEAEKKKTTQNVDQDGDQGKPKDKKVKKDKDAKDESTRKSGKEVKEKKKPEELPRHPGLLLQTKGSNESKLRSLSLSLDSLLEYTDKDIEESTFELSLFAESLSEMLQYQMGSRIFLFLQNLRKRFVMKRNQRKRLQEEKHEDENDKKSPSKRLKTSELSVKSKPTNSETLNAAQPGDEEAADQPDDAKIMADERKSAELIEDIKPEDAKIMADEGKSAELIEDIKPDDAKTMADEGKYAELIEIKQEYESDVEDPVEDPEEYDEVEDANTGSDSNETSLGEGKAEEDAELEMVKGNINDDPRESAKGKTDMELDEAKPKFDVDKIGAKYAELEKMKGNANDDRREFAKGKTDMEVDEVKPKFDVNKIEAKVESEKKEPPSRKVAVVDKELLQAFRFFDQNQVGYLRVEDLRLIIHSLGKFLSHRDVKELVQSALLESNTGRDGHILYNKLLKM